ncbi:MAG: double-strand break repair protein AddB [Rhizobiales bacterium]|nr:double-strand break repair protein AddB [Hyphomicrobiales bacterium]
MVACRHAGRDCGGGSRVRPLAALSAAGEGPSSARLSRVFSVPVGVRFLPAVASALLDGALAPGLDPSDPLALAAVTLYAPTRRAARALAAAIAEAQGGAAAILPRIAPLGALDEETVTWPRDDEPTPDVDPDVAPAIGDMARRLALTRLVLTWARALKGAIRSVDETGLVVDESEPNLVATTPAAAFALAGDLAALIDEMLIEEIDWARLDDLVTGEIDRYWAITLDFLKIARRAWPDYLATLNLVDAARRRAALIRREAKRLRAGAGGPVIAVGSTGTNRATAELLAAIAASPRGAVVLPGLDLDMDEAAWRLVGAADATGMQAGAGHPQAALRRLLDALEVERAYVTELGVAPPSLALRARLLSKAMLPAAATERWSRPADPKRAGPPLGAAQVAQALASVALVEAEDEREEALAAAVALREALQTPGLRAALVTPDRGLARRARADLARWGLSVEDSAGAPLSQTQAGGFARLIVETAAEAAPPARVAALLAHADARLGWRADDLAPIRAALEVAALRGFAPPDPLAGISAVMAQARARAADSHAHKAVRDLPEPLWRDMEEALTRLAAALAPLRDLTRAPLGAWVGAHRAAIAAATRDPDSSAPRRDERARDDLFDELTASADSGLLLDLPEYADFFARLAEAETVGPDEGGHPRLAILGALEARLLDVDLVVLGGLDEEIWPRPATTDAFLNRPMRAGVGLSSPERRIGQSAHDFVMAAGTARLVLTRARKRGGKPTVPSRLLQRLEAVAGEAQWGEARARGARLVGLARLLDAPRAAGDPARLAPVRRPAPAPPVALRPRGLSVTRIETLRRDPYAIYAERILELAPLEPFQAGQDQRIRGVALHEVVAAFCRAHPAGPLPADASEDILRRAREVFAGALDDPDFRALEWPPIVRTLSAYLDWERVRRAGLAGLDVEISGKVDIALPDGTTFRLSANADRIERRSDGSVVVVDYKTGSVPKVVDVANGFSPQLTIEAAMARRGAFGPDYAREAVEGLYVEMKPALGERAAAGKAAFAPLVEAHWESCLAMLADWRDPAVGYASQPFPDYAPRYSDATHLARVQEWSATAGADDNAEGEA